LNVVGVDADDRVHLQGAAAQVEAAPAEDSIVVVTSAASVMPKAAVEAITARFVVTRRRWWTRCSARAVMPIP
jgi:hypothetical protein